MRILHWHRNVLFVLVGFLLTLWLLSVLWTDSTPSTPSPVNIEVGKLVHQPLECRGNLFSVIVTTSARNRVKRDVIRQTWARGENVYFLLGRTFDVELQSRIDHEAVQYGDIIQGSFTDKYRNLVYKSVMGYVWARDTCNATYIVKVDDDCMLHMANVRNYLQSLESEVDSRESQIICNIGRNYKVFRTKKSKWVVTRKEYSDDVFPDFCPGSLGAIFSHGALALLLEQVANTPFLWLEDVYISGLLRRNAGLELTGLNSNLTVNTLKEYEALPKDVKSTLLFGPTDIGSRHVRSIWKELYDEQTD